MCSSLAVTCFLLAGLSCTKGSPSYNARGCVKTCPFSKVDPTCGSDGNLYATECYVKVRMCATKTTISVVPWKDCKANCTHDDCYQISEPPKCGNDGRLYIGNTCTFLKLSCRKAVPIKEVPRSHCKEDKT